MVMQTVGIYDVLDFSADSRRHCHHYGFRELPTNEDNLIYKAQNYDREILLPRA